MNAKEMFKELGYEYYENDDVAIFGYRLNFFGGEVDLCFDLGLGMNVIINEDENAIDCLPPQYIFNKEELLAIKKQAEEIGWLDKDE